MNTQRIDLINIGLMIFSLVLAFLFPPETFLFAIMILGPLHYLTEMPWLEKKGFFIPSKRAIWLLVIPGAVLLFLTLGKGLIPEDLIRLSNRTAATLAGALFILAFILIQFKRVRHIIIGVVIVFVLSWFLSANRTYTNLFLNLFPTLIHVFIFTSAFILFGALRHKSMTGIASLVVYALCVAFIFLMVPGEQTSILPADVIDLYYYQADIHLSLVSILNFPTEEATNYDLDAAIFYSPTGVIVMRFIAFTYMYHFLNWFSKTSVIKWHETKPAILISVFGLWAGLVALYWYDIDLSIRIIYILGIFHVILEYPLNHQSFIGIGRELRAFFFSSKATSAT